MWRSGRASPTVYRISIPGWDRPKSLKQVETASLPNDRQQAWVASVHGDDHSREQAENK